MKNEIEKLKNELNAYKSCITANLDRSISKRYRELLEEVEQYKDFFNLLEKGIKGYCACCKQAEPDKICHHCNYHYILQQFKEFKKGTLKND